MKMQAEIIDTQKLNLMLQLLDWNRSLDEPVIKIGYEYGVADKVWEIIKFIEENNK